MARLHEYQGKAILAANGFRIPSGRAASTADDAVAAANELATGKKGGEVVIKIQAWTTGRANIGGVAFANGPDDRSRPELNGDDAVEKSFHLYEVKP
jgi:succinyl-CoA synthetase beta subunit